MGDRNSGSARGSETQSAPDVIAAAPEDRHREPLPLLAIVGFLLASAGLLFTSLPVISPTGRRSRTPRKSSVRDARPDPIVAVKGADEPRGEPWWLIAFTIAVIIAVGMLFIFYAHLPPFLRF